MFLSNRRREHVFKAAAFFGALTALYHLIGIFYKINASSSGRHALFICINLFLVYGFLKRPKYFVFVFFILLLQQLYSHGSFLINHFRESGKIDWISVFILVGLPIIFACLVADYKSKSRITG